MSLRLGQTWIEASDIAVRRSLASSWLNLAGHNAAQQLGVGIHLRDPDRRIGAMKCVVVVLVVLESFSKRRRTVEADDPEIPKYLNILAARDTQQMKLRLRFPHGAGSLETGEDVARLERDEASKSNVV